MAVSRRKRRTQGEVIYTTILITKPDGEEIQIHNGHFVGDKALVCRSNPCACSSVSPHVVELLLRKARLQGWKVKRFRLGEFYRYKKDEK